MISDDEDGHGMARTECEVVPLRARGATGAVVDRTAQGRIGEQLRAMYEALADAPIPDRIVALLAELDRPDDGAGR
jgi:hypothetical protein